MTMFHDTFCTPSTCNRLIHDKCINNMNDNTKSNNNNKSDDNNSDNNNDNNNNSSSSVNNLRVDTLFRPIFVQPRTSNSSLTTSSATSIISSSDDLFHLNDQRLLTWIQRQLEFYVALSILPCLSSIDDLGHGKLLLCLIHRFAPTSVPTLVVTLEEKTSIECLLLADDLAQRLWNIAIDSLPIYLYQHKQQQQTSNNVIISDYVDQLIAPSACYSPCYSSPNGSIFNSNEQSTTDNDKYSNRNNSNDLLNSPLGMALSSSDHIDEEYHARQPAAINADALPIWQQLTNEKDNIISTTSTITSTTTTTTISNLSSLTRSWIATTHRSIQHYLHQPYITCLSALLFILQQLQRIHVDFARLPTTYIDPDVMAINNFVSLSLQLYDRLQTVGDHLNKLTKAVAVATVDENVNSSPTKEEEENTMDLTFLGDVLVQKHTCLLSWVQDSLRVFRQSNKVQEWVFEQQIILDRVKNGIESHDDSHHLSTLQQELDTWLDSVRHYRQEDQDVLALMALCSRSGMNHATTTSATKGTEWDSMVTRVTLATAIKALDDMDSLVSSSNGVAQQLVWKQRLVKWETIYADAMTILQQMNDSIISLVQQAKWKSSSQEKQLSCTTLLQQWRILAKRVADFGNNQRDIAGVLGMYHQVRSMTHSSSSSAKVEALDLAYDSFIRKLDELKRTLTLARSSIHQRRQLLDFLRQYNTIHIKAMQLERQLDFKDNGKHQYIWVQDQVLELDGNISQLVVQGTSMMVACNDDTCGDDDKIMVGTIIQDWLTNLEKWRASYHSTWDTYLSHYSQNERRQNLEDIHRQLCYHISAMESSLFDPWICKLDDQQRLDHIYSSHKQRLLIIQSTFDLWWNKENLGQEWDMVKTIKEDIDKGKQLLKEYQHSLAIVESRLDWEQKWTVAITWTKKMTNSLHGIVSSATSSTAKGNNEDVQDGGDFNVIQQNIMTRKDHIDQVHQAFDTMMNHHQGKSTEPIERLHQRQQWLIDQVDELYRLLGTTRSIMIQTTMMEEYMSSIAKVNQSSQVLIKRLDERLEGPERIDGNHKNDDSDIDNMDQDIQQLEISVVQLWQQSGCRILYPLTSLMVDDLVRWRVLNNYRDTLAAMVHMVDDLQSWKTRSAWEVQWQNDMDLVQEYQQQLSTWIQQQQEEEKSGCSSFDDDQVRKTIRAIDDYEENQLGQLEQLFITTQQQYPSNVKMPIALSSQQQLLVKTFSYAKALADLVTYLQMAKQLEQDCNTLHATMDENGQTVTEEAVQKWMDHTQQHLDGQLLGNLRDQQQKLLLATVTVPSGNNTGSLLKKENIRLVFGTAERGIQVLKQRLSISLKASQHGRLMEAYDQSMTVLESSLETLQNDLTICMDHHGKMTPPPSYVDDNLARTTLDYQAHEDALYSQWKDTKYIMEHTHTSSYNNVQSLCQLIQLQQEEPKVLSRQSRLDAQWLAISCCLQDAHHLLLALAQWRDLHALLDKVESTLCQESHHYIDLSTMMIKTDLEVCLGVLPRLCQDTCITLDTVNGMVPPSSRTLDDVDSDRGAMIPLHDEHNRSVFTSRFNQISSLVYSLQASLLQRIDQESVEQRDCILKQLADVLAMNFFDDDDDEKDGMILMKQWDSMKDKMLDCISKHELMKQSMKLLLSLPSSNGDDDTCRQSMDEYSLALNTQQHLYDTMMIKTVECGQHASKLLSRMDMTRKELNQFIQQTTQGTIDGDDDWRLDLRVWEHRLAHFENTEMQDFLGKVTHWVLLATTDGMKIDKEIVKSHGQHMQQEIERLVQGVQASWQELKTQLADGTMAVTSAQLGRYAEQQWHELSNMVDDACDRATVVVASFYQDGNSTVHSGDDDDKDSVFSSCGSGIISGGSDDEEMMRMMGQEQELVLAEQALTILEHEMRPLLKTKKAALKVTVDGLVACSTTWIDHTDVDNVLDKWEHTIQQHKQHLRYGVTMCQYWVAAAEVHGYLSAMDQIISKNNPELLGTSTRSVDGHAIMAELETRYKVYSDALDISMEKARQAALLVEGNGQTDFALMMAKKSKLEQRFHDRMKDWLQWIGLTNGNSSSGSNSSGGGNQHRLSGLRSRKISLPTKMPSPPLTATNSTRRRVSSSISSSSSPLLHAPRNIMGRKSSFTTATRPPPPNSYVADPKNDLDMEIGRIVNKVPYKVELQMVPGEAGRYRFGDKVVYCRILKSRMVMVRVGGGWTELSQFLRDHALLVGNGTGFVMRKSSLDNCQEAFLETKRATSPTSGRPLPRMSQSTSTSSITGNAGYKDGDRYIAVDLQGHQHEMKMTPHDSNSSRRPW
ncbi:uncharacterized protein BX664DRAFT_347759 [Halteromyces radiatus]|uniref:uncharacterized protein n=1 Tax=Halteromyces radiatus TaxID=101107 RepID=UPI00221EBE66|nr:uncharacterized protein BX664DRAFT_347759 [Halteromyces radiatus]KAI8092473.1 hypothetical protein BX664DRAFT_347759 [Halteromyces radiatus]